MGNRFASLAEYHVLIQGHGILAAIVFLFIMPASIMIKRFRQDQILARRYHIYLNILAIFLTTVVFVLGWFAVGPNRSLTNPHHGIGLTIYVLMLIQVIGGAWIKGSLDSKVYRRQPMKAMLHQWLGRATALLGIAQVPLGLTLYGSPKFTFVLYALWMAFLLVIYFSYSFLTRPNDEIVRYSGRAGTVTETIIPEKKSRGIGAILAPLAAGGIAAAILGRDRDKHPERRRSRVEVIPSRHGSRRTSRRDSGSYSEEKYDDERRDGGIMNKVLAGAAALGIGALAKSWLDRRRSDREEEQYSAVAPDTPNNRRRRRDEESEISEESIDTRRVEHGRRGPTRGAPAIPVETATAISNTEGPPLTPLPLRSTRRPTRHYPGDSELSYDSPVTPSRRRDTDGGHPVRNSILAGVGLGRLAKMFKDRRDRQERERLEDIRAQELDDERQLESERRRGVGNRPPRFTGDGAPPRNHGRRGDASETSEFSSDFSESLIEPRRGGAMPPFAAGAIPVSTSGTGAKITKSRSRHDVTEPVPMPQKEPRSGHAVREPGSDDYFSAGGRERRRRSSGRREVEAAATGAALGAVVAAEENRRRGQSRGPSFVRTDDVPAAATEDRRQRSHSRAPSSGRSRDAEAAAAGAAVGTEERRQRSQSRDGGGSSETPAVSLKVRLPDERNRNLTLRRLTEEEAAAERKAQKAAKRSRGNSVGSLSGAETSSRRRYRRDESASRGVAESAAEKYVEAGGSMAPLSPPRPAFAGGRPAKDSSYYSSPPPQSGLSLGSPESQRDWSGVGPSGTGADDDAENRRRRRRAERNQRDISGSVDYT